MITFSFSQAPLSHLGLAFTSLIATKKAIKLIYRQFKSWFPFFFAEKNLIIHIKKCSWFQSFTGFYQIFKLSIMIVWRVLIPIIKAFAVKGCCATKLCQARGSYCTIFDKTSSVYVSHIKLLQSLKAVLPRERYERRVNSVCMLLL